MNQGQWLRCTPALIEAGVSCSCTPRRPTEGGTNHEHWIAHTVIPELDNDAILAVARQYFRVDADTSAKSLQAYCDSVRAVLGAYGVQGNPFDWSHSDDLAVDVFAQKMKAKLKFAREQNGRGGWEQCEPEMLSRMLREHVEKGDPIDVANFCMMLAKFDAPISPAEDL